MPCEAVIVAVVEADTGEVPIANCVVVVPVGIVTDAGNVTPEVAELNVTLNPPEGAGTLREIVPVEERPPTTDAGDTDRPVTSGIPKTRLTNPEQMIAPQPEAVSQPGPAFEGFPFGKVPLVPETTS